MPTNRPPTLDATAAARWAALLPPQSETESPWLHEEVARRMEDRLQWMTMKPATWLHWEPLRGGLQAQALLERRYPDSECFVLEALDRTCPGSFQIDSKALVECEALDWAQAAL